MLVGNPASLYFAVASMLVQTDMQVSAGMPGRHWGNEQRTGRPSLYVSGVLGGRAQPCKPLFQDVSCSVLLFSQESEERYQDAGAGDLFLFSLLAVEIVAHPSWLVCLFLFLFLFRGCLPRKLT